MTFLSRIFGLLRDQLFAFLLGAGFYSDAYVIAFRIPNLLRDLFAEGALSNAFVPTFTEYQVKHSRDEMWKLANTVIGALLAISGAVTLAGMIFAPTLVFWIAPGFGDVPGKDTLTVFLTRVMFPFLPTVALSALFMGMLNVHERFATPAFAPVMFNLVSIGFGVAVALAGAPPRTAVIVWSIGTLCGGIAQAVIQVPQIWRLGWRFRPLFTGWGESQGLRQIGRLMLPAVIGLSATQLNILFNSILASLLEEGSPSWLNYAFRLMQLPIGMFGVAVGVVMLPMVSRDAAREDGERMRENIGSSLNLVLVLTIPAAIGLWLLGEPIVRLIYEYGAFRPYDTSATAATLAFFSIGLPFYAAIKVLAPAFFALKNSRAPMAASIIAVAVNISTNLLVYRTLGIRGLALGTSLGALANLGTLWIWFHLRHGALPNGKIVRCLGRISLAASAMVGMILLSIHLPFGPTRGFAYRLWETFVPIIAGSFVYFIVLYAARAPEAQALGAALKKIARRFSESSPSRT